jgi:hypothetical protein
MSFPKTLDEIVAAGYHFKNHAECRGCGESIMWFRTPTHKNIPMNPMERGSSEAIAHWATCAEQGSFRKASKPKEYP